ncbi:uncharacterized protein BO87DRAFT_400939 [Aspergillus neoniger CBS 115656]|uniref:Aminoglycoside phosphotransferase domain-containing protein n=1 Tax=Aspergillus neoniger (strain CBS 115656) TaxID=1448310 RepID=A0A318Y8R6_ASPNB|nr:hypothetical protein BO87DRAFT_400939 [Aspergillus neoniger CBS 115656]PYH29937.1 hypothetical protein BO87DRAFT_400939 [Aspergillus neoniger CBS 115656]
MIQKTQELRLLEDIEISSVSRGPLFDCHLPDDSLHLGPFSSVQSFHQPFTSWHGQHNRGWPIVFTRGDLSSLNILVCGDDIIGIIDWETAGRYPSYRGYTTACQVNPQNSV